MPATHSRFFALSGLRIVPGNAQQALRDTLIAILGVTLFIVVLDALVFRSQLSQDYIAAYTSSLGLRTWGISAMAAIEEVKFRLLVMTGLAILAKRIQGELTAPAALAIILAAQFANVGALVLADPIYATLRYWLVGAVWGWLYWRHGWLAALGGHVGIHPVLDPALKYALT